MKFSYKWLQEFLPIDISVDKFCDKLTMFGLEVEEITDLGKTLDKVVVGKITKVEAHPNADKLSICEVDVNEDSNLQVLCGAPNVAPDQLVPVAKVGATIQAQQIKSVKLRGEESHGMICSEKELDLSDNHDGIMVLDKSVEIGTPLAQALKIDDYMIEVEVTPNRPDLLGLIGITRECAAMLEKKYTSPTAKFQESPQLTSDLLSVDIKNSSLCSRYAARIVKNIKVKPSPPWLQRHLRSVGLRPINNIVDVTNYILMEQGHPIHAFDASKVEDNHIVVRTAKKGETIKLLDEKTYKLNPNNLVIADSKKPMALAGIMGGVKSSITEETTDIVLECACFNALNIRQSSQELKVASDSSYRFERIMDPNRIEEIIDRTAYLIQQTAGGEITKGIVDVFPHKKAEDKIQLRPDRVNRLLKTELEIETMINYLKRFEFQVSRQNDLLEITVPTFRPDITREVDLIEEISRAHGYNNLESNYQTKTIENTRKKKLQSTIRKFLVNQGFYEACNLSFSSPEKLDKLDISPTDKLRKVVELKNPLGEDFSILRTTLIPDLLQNVSHNLHQNFNNFKLFELNKTYFDFGNHTEEPIHLCGAITGDYFSSYWKEDQKSTDFFDVKGLLEAILTHIFEIEKKELKFKQSSLPFYHDYLKAEIEYNKVAIGSFGKLKQDILTQFNIEPSVWIFDIDFSRLFKNLPGEKFHYEAINKFPAVFRDAALVAPKGVPVAEIVEIITSVNPEIIRDVNLFDVYEGEQIASEHRSLAFRIAFQAKDKTLTDKYVDKIFDKIINKLSDEKKIELR